MNVFKLLLLLSAFGIPITTLGDSPVVSNPLSVDLAYAEGLVLRMAREEFKPLGVVVLIIEGKELRVPKDEIKDILSPDLGCVMLQDSGGNIGKREVVITVKYGRRIYEWGEGSSELALHFSAQGYVSRRTRIPVGANKWEAKTKALGAPEISDGNEGRIDAE